MKHTTLTRKSILVAGCLCLAASLTAQTQEKSQQEPVPSAKHDSAQTSTLTPVRPVVSPAMPLPTPSNNFMQAILERMAFDRGYDKGTDKSWVRVEPGVLSVALRNDPSINPPVQRYGAAPAIVNLNFGRK